ncbi:MAG: DUF2490 domain-containing protein [Acidobacteriota bacterium]
MGPRFLARSVGLLSVAACCISAALAFDDFETWSTMAVDYWESGRWEVGFGAELRLDDDSTSVWFVRASQQSRFQASDRWRVDLNLSYVRVRAGGSLELDTLRLELAGTPTWPTGRRSSFDLRFRADAWLREGDVHEDVTLRLRPRWTFDPDGDGGRKTLFLADEAIYSTDLDRFVQNRLVPFGIGLPVGRRARVDLYVMVLSGYLPDGWRHDLVLGQNWTF